MSARSRSSVSSRSRSPAKSRSKSPSVSSRKSISPTRHALSAEEKERYHVDDKTFNEMLKDLYRQHKDLLVINSQLAKLGSAASLTFVGADGQEKVMNKKQFSLVDKEFRRKLLDLGVFHKNSKKKKRTLATTDKAHTGIRAPIVCDSALLQYLNSDPKKFGTVFPDRAYDARSNPYVMDQLALAKQGRIVRNACGSLFTLHQRTAGLQDPSNGSFVQVDDLLANTFGNSALPPVFYKYVDPVTGKDEKYTLEEAVAAGALTRAEASRLSSFDAVIKTINNTYAFAEAKMRDADRNRGSYSDNEYENVVKAFKKAAAAREAFTQDKIKGCYFQSLVALNYYTKNDLTKCGDANLAALAAEFDDPATMAALDADARLINDVRERWSKISK